MIKPWVFEFFPELSDPNGHPDPKSVSKYFATYLDLWTRIEALGYEVKEREKWEYDFGAPCISLKDPKTGILYGGADPRKESWAEGK